MTDRLYYNDSRLLSFDATIVEVREGGLKVVLDRTAFYPSSGGQPNDVGRLNGVRVVDVIDGEDAIVHVVESALQPGPAHGEIDGARRFDHMQQHTGQHLLSAVFEECFGYKTVSFHLGAEVSTIDLETAEVSAEQAAAVERRVNERIAENLPVQAALEDAASAQGLRKPSDREGTLRVVSIGTIDRSACGGTHVGATGEIGCVLLRGTEKMRGNVRVEFVCGLRAVRAARWDFDTLTKIARLYSAAAEDTPALVASTLEQAREADKQRRKLAIALAERTGQELYEAAAPGTDGVRRHEAATAAGAIAEETRTLAQAFTARGKGIFVASGQNPPSVLLAVSAETKLHAGNLLKEALQAVGGRGGGSAQMGQGSAPSAEALAEVLQRLRGL